MAESIKIDYELCTVCGACVEICPDRVLARNSTGRIVTERRECMLCGHCYAVCPVNAVDVPALNMKFELPSLKMMPDSPQAKPAGTPELIQLMRERRSCRSFKNKAVDLAILHDLTRVGTTAPSGTNSQSWQFVILPEREDVIRLGEATASFYERLNRKAANPFLRLVARLFAGDVLGRYYRKYYQTIAAGLEEWREQGVDRLFHGATAVIAVAADKSSSCPAEDALLATQNILLAAQSLGLGTCLIGFAVEAAKRDRTVASLLRIGLNERVYSVIACGYPAVIFNRPAGRKPVHPRIVRIARDKNGRQDGQRVSSMSAQPIKKFHLVLYSFGFKHGVPVDANMVWDVRFLPNPYWQEELRPLSGCDEPVSRYVIESRQGKKFLELLKPLLLFLIDEKTSSEKRNLRLAVGCTGGRHRSVAIVEELYRFLAEQDIDLTIFHRDMEREES